MATFISVAAVYPINDEVTQMKTPKIYKVSLASTGAKRLIIPQNVKENYFSRTVMPDGTLIYKPVRI